MGVYSGAVAALLPWTVTVRDPNLVEYDGQVDGYTSISADLVDATVDAGTGTWQLTLPAGHWAAEALAEEGAGIVLRPAGEAAPIASGDWEYYTGDTDAQRATITFTGVVDDARLAGEVAWSDPVRDLNDLAGQNPVLDSADVRTGPAETVLKAFLAANVGSTATAVQTARYWPWLDLPATAGLGTSIALKGQFTPLLDLARQAASPTTGITWQLRQEASGLIRLVVRERADVAADVVFSHAEGTLAKSTITRRRPATTQAIAISTGDTARTFARVTDSAAETLWMRRSVEIVDGNSDVIADLTAAAAEAITAGREKAGLTCEPVQLRDGPRFGVDYQLGDYVSAVTTTGGTIRDLLTQVTYRHEAGQAPTLQPSIGVNRVDESDALVPIVRALVRFARRSTARS